jgi:hypothetical protein
MNLRNKEESQKKINNLLNLSKLRNGSHAPNVVP